MTPDPVTSRNESDFNVSQVWLDALARGTCDEEAFLRAVQMLTRRSPEAAWDSLALLDQYYRRGKINPDVFKRVKSRLGSQLLGPALDVRTERAAQAARGPARPCGGRGARAPGTHASGGRGHPSAGGRGSPQCRGSAARGHPGGTRAHAGDSGRIPSCSGGHPGPDARRRSCGLQTCPDARRDRRADSGRRCVAGIFGAASARRRRCDPNQS